MSYTWTILSQYFKEEIRHEHPAVDQRDGAGFRRDFGEHGGHVRPEYLGSSRRAAQRLKAGGRSQVDGASLTFRFSCARKQKPAHPKTILQWVGFKYGQQ